jgi:peptidoglycan LD-endopeptidase CwlK
MSRRETTDLLDPAFREALGEVLEELRLLGSPLRIFETARSPVRQDELYERGRDPNKSDFGRTVTKARRYQSAHQFGKAVDMVGYVNGKWTWDLPAIRWKELGLSARRHGLTQLSFEQPHLQPLGWNWRNEKEGPDGEDEWLAWLLAKSA